MDKNELKKICQTWKTEDIIELIRNHRRIDNLTVLTDAEKYTLLDEIYFNRDEGSHISDDTLHDIVYALLPPMPHGREEYKNLQYRLAENVVLYLNSDDLMSITNEYKNIDTEKLLRRLRIDVNAGETTGAKDFARDEFIELWHREATESIPDDVLFSFIRQQIPKTSEPNFREVAEDVIETVLLS